MARIVVTGANRGIGLELTRQLAERGDHVIAACRTSSPELDGFSVDVHEGVDVADIGAVERFAEALGEQNIDILINNAGILTRESFDDLDWDRMRRQYEVNTLGPLRVTKAVLPRMLGGGKVAIVSSRVGSLGDNEAGGNYGYRISKTAVNMAGVNLTHDLRPRGIAVILLHPGYVATEMTDHKGPTKPVDAARGLISRIDELTMETSGTFWHAEGYKLPW